MGTSGGEKLERGACTSESLTTTTSCCKVFNILLGVYEIYCQCLRLVLMSLVL